jgi:signal peptidase II
MLATMLGGIGNYAADRLSKIAAVELLGDGGIRSYFGGTVLLYLAENSGAFLSMGATWPTALKHLVLLIIPIGICLYGLFHCLFKESDRIRAFLIATIVGGGLGNLIDRLTNDFIVIDFLNFGIGSLRTGILNVADLSVTFGALALLAYEGIGRRNTGEEEKSADSK